MKNEELHSERGGKQLFTAGHRLRTAIALPAVLALLGILTLLPACQDDDRLSNIIPGSNPTPGRLAVASVNLDGHSANTRGGAQAAGGNAQAGGNGAQTRVTAGDNTYQTTDGTALVPANISITGITDAGDRMYLRYNFGGHGFGGYDFSKDAANAAAGTTADRTPNARYCTYTTLQDGGDWLTYAGDASTNPLCPNTSGDGSTGAEAGESWAKAQAMLWLAATPQVPEGTANDGSTGIAPSGGLTTTNSILATDPCGMNYRVGTSKTNIPGITDGQYHVRLYADALVAVSSKAAPDATDGTTDPVEDAGATLSPANLTAGQLAIYRNMDGKNLGGICANLAHTGALMQLSEADIKISGEIIGGGEPLTKGTLSALWVEVALDGEEETFFVPFSRVSAAEVPAGEGVWQAIVPGSIAEEAAASSTNSNSPATARVLRFVAQMAMTDEAGTATANGTFVLKQTNGDAESSTGSSTGTGTAAGKALYANLRYPLSLDTALNQFAQQSTVTFILPDGKPQWGEEGTLVDLAQQIEVTYANGTYTYTAKSALGLKAVTDWMADGGTPPRKPAGASTEYPDYSGNDPETNADDLAARMKTNLILPTDIDLGGLTTNSYSDGGAANWRPIGTPSAPYTGTFDGGGFTVKGLDIRRPQADYQGFFGTVAAKDGAGATVKNLTVAGSVEGKDCVAAIVASNTGGSLENCVGSATVKANGTSARAGGVAGLNNGGTLVACAGTAEVSGTGSGSRVGGVVGLNQNNGNLYLCAGMATTLTGDAGGAVGGVTGTNSGGTLTACFTTTKDCKVDGGDGTGGGTRKDCYPIDNKAFGSEESGVGTKSASTETGTGTPVPSSLQDLNEKYLPARNMAIYQWNKGNPGNKCPCYYKPGSPAQSALPTLTVGEPQATDLLAPDGIGTNGQPHYSIGTADELSFFTALVNMGGNYLKVNATLTKDIALPEGSNNWTPIGTDYSAKYTGTFDGAGFTVSGIDIDRSSDYQGFFGYIGSGGTVKRLTVKGKVKGKGNVGGIAGYNNYGTLVACTSQVAVTGTGVYTGGIVGRNDYGGTLVACTSTGAVTGTGSYTGGIAGRNDSGTLNGCYPTNNKVFGVEGGAADGTSASSLEDLNKNYLKQMNFAIIGYNGTAGFPYHYVASTNPAGSLPTLADGEPELKDFFTLAEEAGANKSPVCLLGTADELSLFATLVNTGGNYLRLNATLTADIALPEGTNNWTPIGNSSAKYTGAFDGAGYTVSGIDIDRSSDYQGFFGYIGSGGTVKRLTVKGKVKGKGNVGGIVGRNYYGTLVACNSQVAVTGTGSYIGGIVGENYYGTLVACYSTGAVDGTGNYTGGIAGYNNATLTACYSTGTVTGTGDNTGGVVGYNFGQSTLNACFYQWGTGVPTVGVGGGYGSKQAANAGVIDGRNVYFCPVGSADTAGYGNITWPGVMGTTEGSADEKVNNGSGTATQIPTLNAAITQWNSKNPANQCPYRFVKNTKQGAVTEGVGSEPLVLEEIK